MMKPIALLLSAMTVYASATHPPMSSRAMPQRTPGGCRAIDGDGEGLQIQVAGFVTSNDTGPTSPRMRYGLPGTNAANVTIVTDTTVCRQAAAAYRAIVDTSQSASLRAVHVVRVEAGSNSRYAVWDPDERAGEFGVCIIFDPAFLMVAAFTE